MGNHINAHFKDLKKKIELQFPNCSYDVEESFSTLPPNLSRDLRHAISGFFNEIRHGDAHAYSIFAKNHVHPKDTIITFNYDVSLERELSRGGKWDLGRGYGFDICPGTTSDSLVKLLKLHGSTNWIGKPQSNTGGAFSALLGTRFVIMQPDLDFLGSQNLRDHHAPYDDGGHERGLILPTTDKIFYVQFCKGVFLEAFWEGLWKQAADTLRNSEELTILGYRFSDTDHRAQELILKYTNRNAKISIYSLEQSERIEKRFREHGFANLYANSKVKFEAWVEQH